MRSLPVTVMDVPRGPWEPPASQDDGHLGYLLLGGIVLRELCIARDWSAEMLGEGDFIRPWLEDASSFVTARWSVVEPARAAVLDANAAAQICRYPELFDELLERAVRRSRSLAVHALIEGVHRIEDRLHLLFWHLAERHGQRQNGHVVMPIRLTHAHLARLVGARRPTVTTALGRLEERGDVRRGSEGWLITGDPPVPASIA